MNNTIPWPDDWPEYRNGGQLCDMKVGPCACGAWHQVGEFQLMGFILFRYGARVATMTNTKMKLFPIQYETRRGKPIAAIQIPWIVAEIAYKEYTRLYGTRQTLERLAKRGGFGRDELLDLLSGVGSDRSLI